MNTKKAKIIAALHVELAAAEAVKAASCSDLTAGDVFYSACDRIRAIQEQIAEASMTRSTGYRCSNTADLVAANID